MGAFQQDGGHPHDVNHAVKLPSFQNFRLIHLVKINRLVCLGQRLRQFQPLLHSVNDGNGLCPKVAHVPHGRKPHRAGPVYQHVLAFHGKVTRGAKALVQSDQAASIKYVEI
ncbi:hypothetical protein SDC9_193454 [bioreactor metagenome]|uniref:Uncharacterized protein n=1 Tax=bioreactor metagenome TaxID=1076179 RepID=A0A645I660_9ZZZZ